MCPRLVGISAIARRRLEVIARVLWWPDGRRIVMASWSGSESRNPREGKEEEGGESHSSVFQCLEYPRRRQATWDDNRDVVQPSDNGQEYTAFDLAPPLLAVLVLRSANREEMSSCTSSRNKIHQTIQRVEYRTKARRRRNLKMRSECLVAVVNTGMME